MKTPYLMLLSLDLKSMLFGGVCLIAKQTRIMEHTFFNDCAMYE